MNSPSSKLLRTAPWSCIFNGVTLFFILYRKKGGNKHCGFCARRPAGTQRVVGTQEVAERNQARRKRKKGGKERRKGNPNGRALELVCGRPVVIPLSEDQGSPPSLKKSLERFRDYYIRRDDLDTGGSPSGKGIKNRQKKTKKQKRKRKTEKKKKTFFAWLPSTPTIIADRPSRVRALSCSEIFQRCIHAHLHEGCGMVLRRKLSGLERKNGFSK